MDKDPVVFSTCRDHDARFYRLLYASYQPGSRNERRCACMGSHDATGRHIHRDVTIHSPDCRSTDGCRAVRPEMQRKCLKLTLHLPYPELKMTGNMLFSGLVLLLVCFASNFLLMEIYLSGVLAHELKNHILLTALTWYLAGISGYLLIAWICLEPAWKRRIINLIIAVLLLRIFFLSPTPEAYNKFLPYLLVYTLLTASFSWLSIVRFKAGKQD